MTETTLSDKEKENKQMSESFKLIQEGDEWLATFYHGLGYRIAEDEDELITLAFTMRDILKKWLPSDKAVLIEDVEKMIRKCLDKTLAEDMIKKLNSLKK